MPHNNIFLGVHAHAKQQEEQAINVIRSAHSVAKKINVLRRCRPSLRCMAFSPVYDDLNALPCRGFSFTTE